MSQKALILIVENDVLIAWDIEGALEEAGYRVLGPAPSFERAMELVDAFHPDMVLLDIEISGPKDSIAFAREMLGRHIPVLFVSSIQPADPTARKAAVGILQKPFDAQRLIDAIRLVQEVSAGTTPSAPPSGFELYDWRPKRNGRPL